MATNYKLIETKDFARCGLDWIEAQKDARKRQDAERDRMYGKPVPVNEFEAAARERKVTRLIERLDAQAGHQVTADEVMAMSAATINAICKDEKRAPSEKTIAALADALIAREGKR